MSLRTSISCSMAPASLPDQAAAFAEEIDDLLVGTVALGEQPTLTVTKTVRDGREAVVIAPEKSQPFRLFVQEVPLLQLDLNYHLEVAAGGSSIRVEISTFQVRGMVKRGTPFFWHHIQLASDIRDDPDAARRALEELGEQPPTDEARLAHY